MPTPTAEVPRVSTPSSTPSAAHTARISQPAAIARTSSQADGRLTGASSIRAMTELATAPAANSASMNGTRTMASAASLAASTGAPTSDTAPG